MPGFDGTGPRGMGPMAGGGRGRCAMPVGDQTTPLPPPVGSRVEPHPFLGVLSRFLG